MNDQRKKRDITNNQYQELEKQYQYRSSKYSKDTKEIK